MVLVGRQVKYSLLELIAKFEQTLIDKKFGNHLVFLKEGSQDLSRKVYEA